MKRKFKNFWPILYVLLVVALFPMPAFAYFDPGTGSMILQMLGIAFVAAGGFFVAFKSRILAFFNKRKKNGAAAQDDDMDEADGEDREGTAQDAAKSITPSDNTPDDAE